MSTFCTVVTLLMGAIPVVLLTMLPFLLGVLTLTEALRRSPQSPPRASPTSLPAPRPDAPATAAADHR